MKYNCLEYLKITLVIRHDHHSSIWNMIYLIWFHQPLSMRVHDAPTWALRMSVVLEIVIKFLWPKVCMIRRSIFHHYFNGIWCICIWVRGFTGFWSPWINHVIHLDNNITRIYREMLNMFQYYIEINYLQQIKIISKNFNKDWIGNKSGLRFVIKYV